jgi:hypothetical protein
MPSPATVPLCAARVAVPLVAGPDRPISACSVQKVISVMARGVNGARRARESQGGSLVWSSTRFAAVAGLSIELPWYTPGATTSMIVCYLPKGTDCRAHPAARVRGTTTIRSPSDGVVRRQWRRHAPRCPPEPREGSSRPNSTLVAVQPAVQRVVACQDADVVARFAERDTLREQFVVTVFGELTPHADTVRAGIVCREDGR